MEDEVDHLWGAVVDALHEGIVVTSSDGGIRSANPAALEFLGVASPHELSCERVTDALDLVCDDESPMAWNELPIMATFTNGRPVDDVVIGVRSPRGGLRWLRVSSRRQGAGGAGAPVIVSLLDAPAPGRLAVTQDRRYRAAFDGAALGLLVLDGRNRAVEANEAACALAESDPRRLARAVLCDHLHPEDREPVLEALRVARHGERRRATVEVRVVTRSGHERVAAIDLLRLGEKAHDAADVLVQVTDLTERRREEARLRAEADHDALTGLQNRRSFERALAAHLQVAERYGPTGALLLVDVDRFKVVNDTLGHVAGDEVLRGVARVLGGRLRGSDVVGRLGGDEFAVLLPLASREGAEAVAASIVREVRDHLAAPATVTVSVGAAMIPSYVVAADVLRVADRALYAAKQGGRDRWELAP